MAVPGAHRTAPETTEHWHDPPDASPPGRAPAAAPMRPRRGPGIPASDLLLLAAFASELTPGATAYEGRGAGRACGHADPAAAGWLGSLALSKANKNNIGVPYTS